ncbi:type IV pilus biogenesis/stability protein PilW [Azoarcus communis]|mgnify:CR=1 FL=1|uniref:Type IV pilus biogenesis/stability protein PilW n=1 Tax=Parazoarcus communis SWub3 = DSM 12120 TaxID=1121029 RepID=A0A323UXW7_9RHOO|nr:type IV pilus biogenesis/stability protein PilW [Parazoarcus communis]NMG48905.1 type IV pilus biogenesis/stability protein PilW [Parazoarcus communis]NMG71731.1 type IV pilus biogenesis/stability protein PilW [Parazoarcus communis SWub3 = DSM 12120]PZA17325.1 type IV pilus biogenesis/stability protein PilW [Azoarcus communis] [Parazoarcus communis SWub3 = DSM 12120]
MIGWKASLFVLFSSLALGACVTTPVGGGDAVGVTRPMSDMQPANDAEARARVHVDLGLAYFEVGRYDVALDEAKVALRDRAGYAPAYHLMGLVYMMIGENGSADENFRNALNAAPGDPDFNNSYGWFLCLQGRADDAQARFDRAARNPYYRYPTRALNNSGQCYLRQNQDELAEGQFLRAIQADPANGEAQFQLASIAYRKANYRAAHEQLNRFHQQFGPTSASVWLGLRAARQLGEHDAEASYAQQLRGRFADSAEHVLMLQGKYE